jgi:hypothetical protein
MFGRKRRRARKQRRVVAKFDKAIDRFTASIKDPDERRRVIDQLTDSLARRRDRG